jgi:ubiquinone/menaquinone biosynthesis C-methylase UbiE
MINYDTDRYLQYMQMTVVDEFKKALELQFVTQIIEKMPKEGTVLDIGTATARYPIFFANRGYDVVGIDISHEGLSVAKENVAIARLEDKIRLYRMDATLLNFPGESFDIVTCMMGTICHMSNIDKMRTLKRIQHALKPNGTIILTSWNPECTFNTYLSFYSQKEMDLLSHNSLPEEELISMLNYNSFQNVKSQTITPLSDEQILKLEVDKGFNSLYKKQSVINSEIVKQQGQMYAVYGNK